MKKRVFRRFFYSPPGIEKVIREKAAAQPREVRKGTVRIALL